MATAQTRSAIHAVLGALALLAVMARGLIAPGYMIAVDDQPGAVFAVTICHGDGTPSVVSLELGDRDDGKPAPGRQGPGDGHCVFAALAHVAPAAETVLFPAPAIAPEALVASPAAPAPGRGLAAPPPPARGPPPMLDQA